MQAIIPAGQGSVARADVQEPEPRASQATPTLQPGGLTATGNSGPCETVYPVHADPRLARRHLSAEAGIACSGMGTLGLCHLGSRVRGLAGSVGAERAT